MPAHRAGQHAGVREHHVARRHQQTGRERSRDRRRRNARERMDAHQRETVHRHRQRIAEAGHRSGKAELTRTARRDRPGPAEDLIGAAIAHRSIRHDVAAVAGQRPSADRSVQRRERGQHTHSAGWQRKVQHLAHLRQCHPGQRLRWQLHQPLRRRQGCAPRDLLQPKVHQGDRAAGGNRDVRPILPEFSEAGVEINVVLRVVRLDRAAGAVEHVRHRRQRRTNQEGIGILVIVNHDPAITRARVGH